MNPCVETGSGLFGIPEQRTSIANDLDKLVARAEAEDAKDGARCRRTEQVKVAADAPTTRPSGAGDGNEHSVKHRRQMVLDYFSRLWTCPHCGRTRTAAKTKIYELPPYCEGAGPQ